ncbi:hypothetical protein B0T10DRAFT_551696 [Thelonectria olida]|uniref:Uncharacterized protein n=1 Tax=Thelonectria olida TaxID=1576542 RepID=A0A9P8VZ26_9HYPO|nr:hypothetical protein B0T10DRAFT_551696 [Thelonectria olida]
MKPIFLSAITISLLATTGSATPTLTSGSDTTLVEAALASESTPGCGAAGSCHGFGGSGLCNDRCQHCRGTSGQYYRRGECCGFGGQSRVLHRHWVVLVPDDDMTGYLMDSRTAE